MTEFDPHRPSTSARFAKFGGTVLRAAVILSVMALAGCLTKDEDTQEPEIPAGQLYNQGLAYMEQGKLRDAIGRFDEVDRQHPYTEWARKATLMSAFANFRSGKLDESVTAAQRYIQLYPSSPDAGYAQYLIGQSYLKQIPDITRDQKATQRAIAAMQEVVDKYPNSEYVDDATRAITAARDQLAGKEMQIGRYYLERKEYTAAANRFKYVIQNYANTRHAEEALYRLTETYYSMGIVPEAQTAAAVLGHNFPDSSWYKDAYNLLQKGGVSPEENKGSWISQAFKKVVG